MNVSLLTEEDLSWISRALLHEAVQASRITTSMKKRIVNKIFYAGDNTEQKGWRSIEIFAYGRNRSGNDIIRAWQREGVTDTPNGNGVDPLRNKPGWRVFRVDGITSFQNSIQTFTADAATCQARKYNPHDSDMATIYYSVEPA